MTDDDVVQALLRHRPVGPPGHLRNQVTGPSLRFPPVSEPGASSQSTRWWIWLPAAAGLAITLALGLGASRTHRVISASERQMLAALQEHDELLIGSDDAMDGERRTEAERLLWLADVRAAELAARQPAVTSESR